MTRHFLKDDDLTPQEQKQVLQLAKKLKTNPYSEKPLQGPKTVALIFDKTSTRTQVSFAAGISALGGNPLILTPQSTQLGGKESVPDTSRVLSRMVEMIVWRTSAHEGLEQMAKHATVPVINSLSDDYHPCQVLADIQTIQEHLGHTTGRTAAYLGDTANNMAHSYLLGLTTAGIHVRLAGPTGYDPQQKIVVKAQRIATQTGASVTLTHNPEQAVKQADIVITDTWISMGQEQQKTLRNEIFHPYRVTEKLMQQAAPHAIFMHCLPAYRGHEVTAEVIDGPQSVIWDEAENRVHAQKALMVWLLQQNQKTTDRNQK